MPASVPCPICGTQVPFSDPNMPFCSDRCRLLDIGKWATESYVVPGTSSPDEMQQDDLALDSLGRGDLDAQRKW